MTMKTLWKGVGGRKFLAWLGSVALLVTGNIDQDIWLNVTLVYIGGQSAVDMVMYLKGKKAESLSA